MAAFHYAWELGGIPEADIRTTKDGVIIAFHDNTPARRTNAPDRWKDISIKEMDYALVKTFDAGIKTGAQWAGQVPPAMAAVFDEMRQHPDYRMYLDFKDVSLEALSQLITAYGVKDQLIFTHRNPALCQEMYERIGIQTMQWMGGSPEDIWQTFQQAKASSFYGLKQIQFHLHAAETPMDDWSYAISREQLKEAVALTQAHGIDFEVLPFEFGQDDLNQLLDLGIRWFAVDYPQKFIQWVNAYQS